MLMTNNIKIESQSKYISTKVFSYKWTC